MAGQRRGRVGGLIEHGSYDVDLVVPRQHLARVRVRDEHGAVGAEHLVALGMVVVPMRVDREADVAAAELGNRRTVLRHERREPRVDDQDALRTDRSQRVAGHLTAAGAEQEVQARRKLLNGDARFVALLCDGRRGKQGRARQDDRQPANHGAGMIAIRFPRYEPTQSSSPTSTKAVPAPNAGVSGWLTISRTASVAGSIFTAFHTCPA